MRKPPARSSRRIIMSAAWASSSISEMVIGVIGSSVKCVRARTLVQCRAIERDGDGCALANITYKVKSSSEALDAVTHVGQAISRMRTGIVRGGFWGEPGAVVSNKE